ncbi:ADP-forming succinate--CoA ligase subunit beta [Rhabdochlamydiaceae symbiont of Dictyostelium giganteum]|uniref:ADP-forming succinate--CoA ligase subunit beta n=1 Tax=Rhabdochlamydiaceae symbiont of Dictyostelium giganteum TaxID=3342349 RepID=UPI00384DC6F6
MHLHEYQAKEMLQKAGILVPPFKVINHVSEVDQSLDELMSDAAFVKVQVHAGGRGKAGGVKLGKNQEEVKAVVSELLGMSFCNAQTGGREIPVQKVIITPPITVMKEFYISLLIDRAEKELILIASSQGGVDIEEVAKNDPQKILRLKLYQGKLRPYHLLRLSKMLGWEKEVLTQGKDLIEKMITLFMQNDALIIEINPLVLDAQGMLNALDAKITLDDTALFRQPLLATYFDPTQDAIKETLAREHDLSYVELKGSIGCMVNGAGLAMATMDMIAHVGGSAANFLDVGGSATIDKIRAGLDIILSDSQVRVVLINIFGGIMNCETFAEGVISSLKEKKHLVPLVVRMEGTESEKGRALLEASKLPIHLADSLLECAKLSLREAGYGNTCS